MCENIILRTSPSGFIDNVNILTFNKSIEQNYKNLKYIYFIYKN